MAAATRSPTALLATLSMMVVPLSSSADEPTQPPDQIRTPVAEILESLDQPEEEATWLSLHLDRVGVHRKYGLTYRHTLEGGDKGGVRFTIRGPVLGKPLSKRRRVGLSFEIHF